MSNPDRSGYRNPLTRFGVHFGGADLPGYFAFRVEECGYYPRGSTWNFDSVLSPFWRLYWNAAPGSQLIVSGRRYPLRPDAVLVVPEEVRFDTRGCKDVPHLWLHFSVLPHFYPREAPRPLVVPLNAQIQVSLQALMACWKKAPPLHVYYHRSAALLHAVLAGSDGLRRPPLPPSLEKLLGFIHANLDARLDNPVLAGRCHRSLEGFIRWFEQSMRVTPQQYVARARVQRAARELSGTEDSIDQIAARLGFPNRNYFSRVFARQIGLPPATFRRRAQAWKAPASKSD